jgi:DNA-binding NarL/FixJ family response regulator
MALSQRASEAQIAGAIDTIVAGLEKAITGFIALRENMASPPISGTLTFDPKDPRNKYEVGGLQKLTPRGVEVCYRLFDKGLSRYAVAQAMEISFGAATHRLDAWRKAGGVNRSRHPLR